MSRSEEISAEFTTPALYVVATPIGHLDDVSPRAVAALMAADLVACEDTRESARLLRHVGARAHMFAVHEHNEQQGAARIVAAIEQGQRVALVSDAGTPAVSDPGARVVRAVQQAGLKVVPVAGPCAAIVALSASGLIEAQFRFVGFLPPKGVARRKALEALRDEPCALVFYEAPHRILECVDDIAAVFEPERELVIARELTKLFEQIVRVPAAEAPAWLREDANRQRGEFVLVLGSAPQCDGLAQEDERVLRLLLAELPLSRAVKLAQAITGASRQMLYDRALALAGEGGEATV